MLVARMRELVVSMMLAAFQAAGDAWHSMQRVMFPIYTGTMERVRFVWLKASYVSWTALQSCCRLMKLLGSHAKMLMTRMRGLLVSVMLALARIAEGLWQHIECSLTSTYAL